MRNQLEPHTKHERNTRGAELNECMYLNIILSPTLCHSLTAPTILVEPGCMTEHPAHVRHFACVPLPNVFAKSNEAWATSVSLQSLLVIGFPGRAGASLVGFTGEGFGVQKS